MSLKVALITLGLVAMAVAHGTSYTKLSKAHESKFDYKIEHSKHGSWHGSAHPHGYGGLGDGHGRWRRSAYSKTVVSRPHSDKYEYDIEHSKHGSWHGAAHPNGAGGLGDGTGSYQLGGHSKVIGLIPQGGGWGRYKRSPAEEHAYSETKVSRPDSDKYEYDIKHSKHGSWHGAAHPNGAGGLGDGTGSYQLGGHSKATGLIPQGGGRYKRSPADEHAYSETKVSRPHEDKYSYDIKHSKKHGDWHGYAHPHGYGGL